MRIYKVRFEEFPYFVCPDREEEHIFSIELNKSHADPFDEHLSIDEFMLRGDVRAWLDSRFGPDFYDYDALDGTLAFSESKDLMLFKLRWLSDCSCTPMVTVDNLSETYVDL